ncbi:MAG TPA: putative sulfate exporter family transporter [Acidobacteriaceae bacterium]|nr:putative sulfate exporter family transporter [Acidobacteriaceae bacterium]
MNRTGNRTALFFIGIILAAAGILSPPMALVAGLVFGLCFVHPMPKEGQSIAKFLLQASVVLLGFGMNLGEVIHAGRAGFFYTAIGLSFALILGLSLGKLMQVAPKASLLITCGTAICGGSAIAAVAPVADAGEEDMAIALGTVFTLNAVALLLFPFIGWHLHMSQTQFGLWAALAIHDTSSVVGAAAKYGSQALAVGTTVKLARALWIIPVALVTAMIFSRRGEKQADGKKVKIQIPWFIGLFVLAAVARTYLPQLAALFAKLNGLGKSGLTVVLFLIGAGLSRETIRRVGVRPMVQGVALWVVIATCSLMAIRAGWISL